jgi:hypothetical protein
MIAYPDSEDVERPFIDDSKGDIVDSTNTTNQMKFENDIDSKEEQDDAQSNTFRFGEMYFFWCSSAVLYYTDLMDVEFVLAPLAMLMHALLCSHMLSKALCDIFESDQQNFKLGVLWVVMQGHVALSVFPGTILFNGCAFYFRIKQQQKIKTKKYKKNQLIVNSLCFGWVSYGMFILAGDRYGLSQILIGFDSIIISSATCMAMKLGLFYYQSLADRGGDMFGEAKYNQMLEERREQDEQENEKAVRRQHLMLFGNTTRTEEELARLHKCVIAIPVIAHDRDAS